VNIQTQIDGQRLAKSVASRTAALEVINERYPVLSWWQLPLIVLMGIGSSWLGTHGGTDGALVLAIVATLGVALALNACIQCIKLRKRVDAVLVLLSSTELR
jgi:uncharacterized membrane protein